MLRRFGNKKSEDNYYLEVNSYKPPQNDMWIDYNGRWDLHDKLRDSNPIDFGQ